MGLMSEALVLFDVKATKKEDVISALADAMHADGRLNDRDQYVDTSASA